MGWEAKLGTEGVEGAAAFRDPPRPPPWLPGRLVGPPAAGKVDGGVMDGAAARVGVVSVDSVDGIVAGAEIAGIVAGEAIACIGGTVGVDGVDGVAGIVAGTMLVGRVLGVVALSTAIAVEAPIANVKSKPVLVMA